VQAQFPHLALQAPQSSSWPLYFKKSESSAANNFGFVLALIHPLHSRCVLHQHATIPRPGPCDTGQTGCRAGALAVAAGFGCRGGV